MLHMRRVLNLFITMYVLLMSSNKICYRSGSISRGFRGEFRHFQLVPGACEPSPIMANQFSVSYSLTLVRCTFIYTLNTAVKSPGILRLMSWWGFITANGDHWKVLPIKFPNSLTLCKNILGYFRLFRGID